jgi:hypothetical protein
LTDISPEAPVPAPETPPPRNKTGKAAGKDSALVNIAVNVVLPALIMAQLSDADRLGPVGALLLALAFPIGYGVREFYRNRAFNLFSALGFFSTLLTGGFALFELPAEWIIAKETGVPLLIGIILTGSQYTRWPLVRMFFAQMLDLDRIAAAYASHGQAARFERHFRAGFLGFGASFFLSAVLNYALARMLLVSAPGTPAFVSELGRMTALSLPVITVPMFLVTFGLIAFLLWSVDRYTDLKLEEAFRQ